MNKKAHGFTIVELLIVIVIIAILAAITLVAYNGITARANDSRRRSDIKNIETALEIYFADNGQYPAVTNGIGASARACITSNNVQWRPACWNGADDSNRLLPSSTLGTIPVDPVNIDVDAGGRPNVHKSRMYCYMVSADGQGYRLGAYLESIKPTDQYYFDGGTDVSYCNFTNYLIRKNY